MMGTRETGKGFTIVELLIVIVIIAVLAAITLVAFNGVQNRANASAATSAASQAKRKLMAHNVENGSYPSALADANIRDNAGTTYQYTGTATTFCVTATKGSSSSFASESSDVAAGACAGHLANGEQPVQTTTNLVTNPNFETHTGAYFTNFGSGGAGNYTRPNGGAFSGSSYGRMTWTTAPTGVVQFGTTSAPNLGVVEGESYTFSTNARTSWNGMYRLYLYWKNSSNVTIGSATIGPATTIPNSWTKLSATATAPSGATGFQGFLQSTGSLPSVGATTDLDGTIMSSPASEFADGSTSGWTWNGAPHNSQSSGPVQ